MRVDWRLLAMGLGVGAYFLARFLGATTPAAVAIAIVLGFVVYTLGRTRRGGPRDPNAAA